MSEDTTEKEGGFKENLHQQTRNLMSDCLYQQAHSRAALL